MGKQQQVERCIERFPILKELSAFERQALLDQVKFPVMSSGEIAYAQNQTCQNYLMCIEGRTRVFKVSSAGREILIYKVTAGGTCVLTTQCLLTGSPFPAESIAEARTELAAIPAPLFRRLMQDSPAFRGFVIADYSKLLASLFTLVDEVAFAPLEQRLARRLLAEADGGLIVTTTHQKLADDVGSVREMVSRYLGEWERAGWVRTNRGSVEILDASALASRPLQ